MSGFGLAVAQLECVPLDVAENVDRTCEAIAKAAAGGAELVVLPELVSCGYVLDAAALRPLAESPAAPGPALSAWARCAAAHRITVVAGYCELAGGRLYNSAVVIGPDGEPAGHYRKLHLFGAERDVFAPGDLGLPLVEVAGRSVGVLICYDLRFPEALRILAVRGAELVAVPTAWVTGFDATRPEPGPERIGQVEGVLVQANLNGLFVACADQVGATQAHTFLGRSLVVDPYGRPTAGPLGAREPGVEVVEVRFDSVLDAGDRGGGVRPLLDRRTDVYDEALGYRDPAGPAARG